MNLRRVIPPASETQDGKVYGRGMLGNALAEIYDDHLQTEDPIKKVEFMLDSLVAASEMAFKALNDPSRTLAFGESWDQWVVEVTAALKTRGLRIGARHHEDKGTVSPFVALIHALHDCMPRRFRQHSLSTTQALARAINRARESKQRLNPG